MRPSDVVKMVEHYFEVKNIKKRTRKRPWVYYRYVYFKMCSILKDDNGWSYAQIGEALDDRDHATALHGKKKFDDASGQAWFEEYDKALTVLLNRYDIAQRKRDGLYFESIEECKAYYQLKLLVMIDKNSRVRRNLFQLKDGGVLDDALQLPEPYMKELGFILENFVERKKKEMRLHREYSHLL